MIDTINTILTNFYDLGQFIHLRQIHRGYFNETYEIKCLKDKKKGRYFLRRYRAGMLVEKIEFEHALMNQLVVKGFDISPRIIRTKNDSTYVKLSENITDPAGDRYICVFSSLPGKDKYDWHKPLCTDAELTDAAKVLAIFHNALWGWKGISSWTDQRYIDMILSMPKRWRSYAQQAGESLFDQYFLEQFEYIYSKLCKIQNKNLYNKMPHLAIHGDYHPGNLKFEDGKVTGVFDFDWSKIDIRCYDVALALLYFCSAWHGNEQGRLQLDRAEGFVEAYQKAAGEMNGVGALDLMELEHLPEMIRWGNLTLIDWILEEFCSTNHDPRQFKKYLRHSVHVMQWMERNWDQLNTFASRFGNID